MIVKIPLVMMLLIHFKDVTSVSISKVFLQNVPDYPAEYIQYGTPVSYSQPISQLPGASSGSVAPYTSNNYISCGSPCIYPNQLASVAPSANIVQYQSPSLPVVVTKPKSVPSGYEYSYLVYDEQTGDHKTQRELSDGSLVRGGYSFLQPDGFVREVQYVADDVKGFNAVVKNYLPVTVETKKPDDTEKPSHEDKKDNLKTEETESSHENLKVEVEPAELEPQPHHEKVQHEDHHEAPEHSAASEHHESAEPHEIPHTVYEIDYKTYKGANILGEHTKPIAELEIKIEPEETVEPAAAGHDLENSNVLVPYNDIIRCVQAALSGVQETSSPHKPESPLTYIILNKPC